MSLWLVVFCALSICHSQAQPGQCNHKDGDYPGCGLSKLTHSSSQPTAGKTFMYKYFPVQTPGDECTDDVCDCDATSSHAAWHIKQGRVYTTRQISPSGGGAPPGNGFGLHLVDVPAHLTTGGLTTEQVEEHFASKLGDMSRFDSFMDFNAIFATSGLQNYKDTFKADGVKYLPAVWNGPKGSNYTSIIVQVPGSQLILELCQQGSLTYKEGEMQPVKLEQRVPDSTLAAHEEVLSTYYAKSGASSVGSYIVSLGVNRAVSAKAMTKLEEFYVTGMGTTKTHDSTEGDVIKKCFLWPGATGNLCFINRPDSATSGDWKVGNFEDMLNTVHSNLLSGHPFCPVDKWFDNHYAIDSQSVDASKILNYVNEKNPFHICASSGTTEFPPSSGGLKTIFDPTGWAIQLDVGSLGTPNDCNSEDKLPDSSTPGLQGGTFNPACTTDTSKCGTGLSAAFVV
jgi:hypothetical protein